MSSDISSSRTINTVVDRLRHSALAIPVAVLLALATITISEMAHHGAKTRLAHLVETGKARVLLQRLLLRVAEAESGKRGYILAGGDEYLRPYQTARQDAQAALQELERLYTVLGDHAAEQQRQRMAEVVNAKLSEMEEVLALHRQGRYDSALEVIRSGIGRDLMNQLRAEGDALLAVQSQRVADGVGDVFHTLRLNRIGVLAVTLVSLAVLVLFVRQGRLLDRHRQEQQQQALAERDRLEQEVQRRTGELTELARHLQTAREDERARLARDLHDELGALLTAAKLDVARMRPKLQQSAPDLLPRLTHLTDTLNSGIALKRRIIEDLRPSTLASLGLRPSLEILCTEFTERSGVAVRTDLQPATLGPAADLTVFRMVQEALTNVAKYAQATAVVVRLEAADGWAEVTVSDNGIGFDPAKAATGRHGLVGMRYRVAAERGQLGVRSAPGQGTTLVARLPVLEAAGAPETDTRA